MATTALVTEILIVGLEAEAWVAMLVLAVFGTGWVDLGAVRGWEALVTILVFAIAYVLGIVVDRLADSTLRPLRGRDRPGFSRQRLEILHSSSGISPLLEYQRSRLRVARGTLFNLPFVAATTAAFVAVRSHASGWWVAAVGVVAAVVLPTMLFATRRIGKAYEKNLTLAHSVVSGGAPQRTRAVVAAVCHRGMGEAVEFLLVRTKGGKRWTFPKGHVEPGETALEAAAREALEEAGVMGRMSGDPLTTYLYPAGSDDAREREVTAYLLAVEQQTNPGRGEKRRAPAWFDPVQAEARLAEEREPKYAAEHARVLRAARAALASEPGIQPPLN